jgi:hypothetical protein
MPKPLGRLKRTAGIVAVFALLATAPAYSIAVQSSKRFDPDGSFWILGKPPSEFENIGGINLNSRASKRLPLAGVELVNGRRLRFKTLSVKREALVFTTDALQGVSYSFSGRFLRGGVFSAQNLDEETPVLEGTLTKLRSGRKVAEAKLKFTYFGGT